MASDPQKSAIRSLLRTLNASNEDIEASAVISSDGLVIASVLGDNADPDRFGAMCASLLALADRAAQEIARGSLRQILVEGDKGTMLLTKGGPDTVLAVSAKAGANLGMIFVGARKTAQQVHSQLSR